MEHEYPSVSCAVDLFDNSHRRIAVLGVGMAAVRKLADYAESGAQAAVSVTHSFSSNYDLEFLGAQLKPFLEAVFPKACTPQLLAAIDDGVRYTVSSFDMS